MGRKNRREDDAVLELRESKKKLAGQLRSARNRIRQEADKKAGLERDLAWAASPLPIFLHISNASRISALETETARLKALLSAETEEQKTALESRGRFRDLVAAREKQLNTALKERNIVRKELATRSQQHNAAFSATAIREASLSQELAVERHARGDVQGERDFARNQARGLQSQLQEQYIRAEEPKSPESSTRPRSSKPGAPSTPKRRRLSSCRQRSRSTSPAPPTCSPRSLPTRASWSSTQKLPGWQWPGSCSPGGT